MKLLAVALLALAAPLPSGPQYARYERILAPSAAGQTCAVLPSDLFPHANLQLTDLRLFHNNVETPFFLGTASTQNPGRQLARILNLGQESGLTAFDAAMPSTSYSTLQLDLGARDFVATVTVFGKQSQSAPFTRLGDFTIFDLTHQQLGRSTVLHLPPSDFPYLHLRISQPILPSNVQGLTVRQASAEPRFQTVAPAARTTPQGHETVIAFTVPAHLPVDRVSFSFGSTPAAFSRDVHITAAPDPQRLASTTDLPPEPATFTGNLLRLHTTEDGRRIDEERDTVDVSWPASSTPSQWTVSVDNGDDAPLPVNAVRLEMAEQTLCFDAAPAASYTLTYGDPALDAPRYDYATLFVPSSSAHIASFGPERSNPSFQSRPDDRPFSERHPILLWLVLLAVLAVLGLIAVRSIPRHTPGN